MDSSLVKLFQGDPNLYPLLPFELTIGGIAKERLTTPLVYVPAEPAETFQALNIYLWALNTIEISINGKTSRTLSQALPIVIDSETSNLVFTPGIIKALISPDIKPLDGIGTWGIKCDTLDSLHPELQFNLVAEDKRPLRLRVPAQELFVGKYAPNPTFCQTYINSLDGVNVLGNSLLKYYYTAWDMEAKTPKTGFALNVSSS